MAFGNNHAARVEASIRGELSFKGSPCRLGHVLRYTSTAQCIECHRALHPQANPDAPRKPFNVGMMVANYLESPLGRERSLYLDNLVRKHLGLKPIKTVAVTEPTEPSEPTKRRYRNVDWQSRLVLKTGRVNPPARERRKVSP
jgi:hypothetical protein